MGSLSNLYISQSYQSLAHLGTNSALVPGTMTELQDGIGQSLNINFDGTNISSSGNIFAANITASVVDTGSLVTTSSFNAYTSSTNIRLNNLESTSASVNVSISNLNSTTQSLNTSITNLNSFTQSQQSFNSSATASISQLLSFSSSLDSNFVTEAELAAATGSLIAQINTKLNTSSFNSYTQSNDQRVSSLESNSASVNISISNINSTTQSLQSQLTTIGGQSGSWITESETGSFVTTSSFNSYTSSTDVRLNNIETTTASLLVETSNLETFSASALISINSLNGKTGSYATTGSNTFTGDQTFIDNGGNFFTITDSSGSLMLVAKSFTSSSLHLTSSFTNSVNLIFKNNDNTGDTIISGSNNIFVNPNAPQAGFKRYIGGNNNIFNGLIPPQISGSMGFSPGMGGNIGAGTVIMRGPVSASAWNLNSNLSIGAVQIGPTAVLHAEKLTAGLALSANTNIGTLAIVANQTALTGSSTVVSQNVILGATTLTLSSSAITMQNNFLNDSGFSLVNNFHSSSAGLGQPIIQKNIIGGTSNLLFISGAQNGGTNVPSFSDNMIFGGANILYGDIANAAVIGANSYHSANRNLIFGQSLIVTGSSVFTLTATQGSAFIGRFNAADTNRNRTAQTIFAVGTGTATGTRKTGFLIDSGSNTFVEGSLNVSGSAIFSSSVSIRGNTTFTTADGAQGNIILGDNAMANGVGNTTAVAIGTSAMRYASGSTQNVAIGQNALIITSGSNNFGLGSYTLENNTLGSENVALGTGALNKNTIGQRNIGIGNGPLFFNTDGERNIAIGYNAGANTSGSNNILIGYEAGGNVSGSRNVIIGGYKGSAGELRNDNVILSNGSAAIVAEYNGEWRFPVDVNVTGSLTIQSGSGDLYVYGHKQFNVGAFQSNVNQSGSANVSQSMNFEVTDISEGVSIVSNSRITLANSGTYNIQFSAQILADTGADDVYIWLKKNGTNVTATAGHVVLANNEELIAAWNYVVDANANDYYELAWQSSNGDAILLAEGASGNIPSIPSVILTVTQVR